MAVLISVTAFQTALLIDNVREHLVDVWIHALMIYRQVALCSVDV